METTQKNQIFIKRVKIIFLILAIFGIPPLAYYHVKHPTAFSPEPLKEGLTIPDPSLTQEEAAAPPDDFVLMDVFEKVNTTLPIISEKGKLLPLPFLVPWCEGEWCGHVRSKTLMKEVKLFQNPDLNSPVLETLKKGSLIKRGRVFTKVNSLGKFTNQDGTVSVVTYASEGQWVTYQEGKWDSIELGPEEEKSFTHPRTEAWIYVELPSGTQGWIVQKEGKDGDIAPFQPAP